MSKYIKLEDAIRNINLEVTGRKEYTGDMKANLFFALDDLPTIEVGEDCISREWVYNELTKVTAVTPTQIDMLSDFADIIKNAPSVVPTTEQSSEVGEWLPIVEATEMGEPYIAGIYCSECGETLGCEANYCPNCGSKMRGVK